jgi:hypothetical protein
VLDIFQAKQSSEIVRARSQSATLYADLVLQAAARVMLELGGTDALDRFRDDATAAVEADADTGLQRNIQQELAVEQIERVIQVANGRQAQRGWTEDGTSAIEEQKP